MFLCLCNLLPFIVFFPNLLKVISEYPFLFRTLEIIIGVYFIFGGWGLGVSLFIVSLVYYLLILKKKRAAVLVGLAGLIVVILYIYTLIAIY